MFPCVERPWGALGSLKQKSTMNRHVPTIEGAVVLSAPRPRSFCQWPRAPLLLGSSVLLGSLRFVLPSVQESTSLSSLLSLLFQLGLAWLALRRAHQLVLGLRRFCLQTPEFGIHSEQGFLKGSLLTTCA